VLHGPARNRRQSIRASCLGPSRAGSATKLISSSSANSRAWSVAGGLLTLTTSGLPNIGRKVSDEFTVPLCRVHHREVHRCGDETEWWNKIGVDPLAIASALWAQTHPLRAGTQPTSAAVAQTASADTSKQPVVAKSGTTAAQPLPKGSPSCKTNPILEAGSP
jgi:hypothetical protein